MIRKANKNDALNLAAFSLQVWLNTYTTQGIRTKISRYALSTFTEQFFLTLLEQPSVDFRVFEQEGHLVGVIVIDTDSIFNEDSDLGYEIVTLYVSRHFQGSGIGRKLLGAIANLYGVPFWLSTWIENHAAIGFNQKAGCKAIGDINFDLEGELHSNHVFGYSGK